MGRRYSINGSDTNTSNTTILGVDSATTIKPVVYDIILASKAAPADYAAGYEVQRYTVAGTSTPVTPQALDPDDPSSLASAGKAHSSEPTYTSNEILLYFSANQRATFRWVAAPNGGLVLPALAANGIGIRVDSSSTAFTVDACMHFEE